MTTRLQPKWDTLPPAQRELWPMLSPARSMGFVLYGGTAIALRLGHRQSVDFDLFSNQALDRCALEEKLPLLAKSTVLADRPDTLTVLVPTGAGVDSSVKVSFFGGIRFGRVGWPQLTVDGCLEVASIEDLLATKLKTVLQRVESKDYRDIAALIGAGADLATGLAAARELFGRHFQPSECLKALVYFQGGDLHLLEPAVRDLLVKAAASVRSLPFVQLRDLRLGAAVG